MPIRIKICCFLLATLACTNVGYAIYILLSETTPIEKSAAWLSVLVSICFAFCVAGFIIRKTEARLFAAILLIAPGLLIFYRFAKVALIPRTQGYLGQDPTGYFTFGYASGMLAGILLWTAVVVYLLYSGRNSYWFIKEKMKN